MQAEEKYVVAHWPQGSLLLSEPLRNLEEEFGKRFIRIHRSTLVAVKYISGLARMPLGQRPYYIKVTDMDARLMISRRHLPGVRQFIRSL